MGGLKPAAPMGRDWGESGLSRLREASATPFPGEKRVKAPER